MTVVHVAGGALEGTVVDGIHRFLGIPYGAPPEGPRRFVAPQPAAAWDGVRPVTAYGDSCIQPALLPGDPLHALYNPGPYGTDCLNLNVWTPDPGAGGLPVIVWIHGGGFINGTGASKLHEGTTFARDGVVFVTINYRLGADGFCYLGPGTANLGLQDHVLALQWVQDNIAAFGGDPGNVTVAGQSAGAVSVQELLGMPSAAGLFRRAISCSGSSFGAEPLEGAIVLAEAFAARLGVPCTPEGIGSVPTDRLLSMEASFCIEYLSPALWGARSYMISPFRPMIDGEVQPRSTLESLAAGASKDVDLLVGTTSDECTFAMLPTGLMDEMVPEWAAMTHAAFGTTPELLETYRKTSRPDATESELLMAAWTDWAFRIPSIRTLEQHQGRGYLYEFAWDSPTVPLAGSAHDIDHAFAFDRLDETVAEMTPILGDLNVLGDSAPQSLTDAYHGAWVRFAGTGDPGWPAYEEGRRATMRFDTECELIDDLAGAEREMWAGRR